MSTPAFVLFLVCGFLAIFGAIGTVASRRPLRSAMSLLVNIIALAGLYLTLQAHLLAVIQLLVYAGAVVVLFVFVIMLIGPDAEGTSANGRGVGIRAASLALMGMLTATIAFSLVSVVTPEAHRGQAFGTTEALGTELFSKALIPFEVISITLTVAIIGAIAIARRPTPEESEGARRRREATEALTKAAENEAKQAKEAATAR